MDNVIDKLILEWSWRCEKGYPDINDPKDLTLLDRLLKEYGLNLNDFNSLREEEKKVSVDDLINLLNSKKDELDDQFIQTIFKSIENKGKGLSSKIIQILKSKNIDKASSIVLSSAQRLGLEEDLLNYLEKEENSKPGISSLKSNSDKDLVDFFSKETNLPVQFLKILSGGDAPIDSKGVGKAEYLLALLTRGGSKQKIGDVEIEGKSVEVKADGARLGERAGNLEDLYQTIERELDVTPRTGRGKTENLFNYLENVISIRNSQEDQEILRSILNSEFDNAFEDTDLTDRDDIRKTLYNWYVDTFYRTEPSDLIFLFIKGKYKLYTLEEFREDVLNQKIILTNFSKSVKAPQVMDFI